MSTICSINVIIVMLLMINFDFSGRKQLALPFGDALDFETFASNTAFLFSHRSLLFSFQRKYV